MRYVEPVFRPPSEAGSFLLQATVGCSWNHCTYCAMYRDKQYRVRPLSETLEDIAMAGSAFGDQVRKVFVLDGDALAMDLDLWEPILQTLSTTFPKLRRVSPGAEAAVHRPGVWGRRHAETHRQRRHVGRSRRGRGQGPGRRAETISDRPARRGWRRAQR
jgi:hypothetical protein